MARTQEWAVRSRPLADDLPGGLFGIVQDDEHNRIPDVIVQARRLASVMSVEDGVIRAYEGVTDEGGNFEWTASDGLKGVL